MSVHELASALGRIGLGGRVEARGKLAVLVLRDPSAARDPDVREAAVAAAREHGFTNLALELDEHDRAPLPGD